MNKKLTRIFSLVLVFCLCLTMLPVLTMQADAATNLPASVYLEQAGTTTCTLCSATMMLRARMYISGNSDWAAVTESRVRPTAWIEGSGLRWSFTYKYNDSSMTVAHTSVSGISISSLKSILNSHPEGVVLYCGKLPHAVFVTDYEGDAFYCADPLASYSGRRISLSTSYLGKKYGSQADILSNVTAYWYISSYSIPGAVPSVTHTKDSSYGTNFTAYPKAKITAENIFDANHNQIDRTSWIGTSDKCTIHEVYTDGCCKVTYPLDAGGTKTVYSKIELFNVNTHTHNYTGLRYYESEHPHKIWQTCVDYDTCGGWIYTGKYYEKNTCEQCWHATFTLGATSVYLKVGESKTIAVSASGCLPDSAVADQSFMPDNDVAEVVIKNKQATFTGLKAGTTDFSITIYSDSSQSRVIATVTIPVKVINQTYTVSYNANGGNGTPGSQTKTHGTALALSSAVPERLGYTFLGWSTSSTATTATYKPGDSFTTNANTTLYAVWQAAATISSGVTNSNFSTTISFAKGYKYYSFTPSVTAKYQLESTGSTDTQVYIYNTSGTELTRNDDSGDNRNFLLTYQFTAGTKYYVKVKLYNNNTGSISFTVKRVYTVSYNGNGGSGAPASQEKVHGNALTLSSNTPTRSGYTFLGWSTSSTATTATYQPGASFNTNADTTLYAVWKRNGYSITYNANGGTWVTGSSIPVRTGYEFLGWSTDKNATTPTWALGQTIITNADIRVYAVWKHIAHTYSSGICSVCDYEFPLTVTAYNRSATVISAGGANIWNKPYSSGTSQMVRTAAFGSKVIVVGKVANASGNLWYKLSDGSWVYSSNVRITDYNPAEMQTVNKTFVVTSWGANVWSKPYSSGDSKVAYSVDKAAALKIVAQVRNSTGGLWYKLSTGGWIYSHNVTEQLYDPAKVVAFKRSATVMIPGGVNIWGQPATTAPSKVARVAAYTSKLNVVAKYTTPSGDLWYQLTDGNWVYSGNVRITDYNPADVQKVSKTVTVTSWGANVWSKPYSSGDSKVVKTVAKAANLKIDGQVRNSTYGLWYHLADGSGWIYSQNVKVK